MALSERPAGRRLLGRPRAPKPTYPPMSFRKWWRTLGWRHVVLLVAVLFALYPLAWMVSASINPIDTLSGARLIPAGASLDNYGQILDNPPASPFMSWLATSWKISLIVALANVLLGAMSAYAFSRFRFTGRRVGLLAMLLVQVFPQFLAFVAIFLILDQMGDVVPSLGLDTHLGLILVYLGGAIGFNTFLIKGFMDSVPLSLDESARVDGATPTQIFWRIILPLVRPALAVIGVIAFVTAFSEFVLARTLLTTVGNLTYAVGLQTFTLSEYASRWGQLAAGAVIGSLPIVVTFLVFQRAIVSGLTQGAVKG
ncbi:MAG: sugar ABC transporter permease [Acidimicrobiia bacterium]|nr:sugar ABC transporter permease [Acidimicrobiia bacterium]